MLSPAALSADESDLNCPTLFQKIFHLSRRNEPVHENPAPVIAAKPAAAPAEGLPWVVSDPSYAQSLRETLQKGSESTNALMAELQKYPLEQQQKMIDEIGTMSQINEGGVPAYLKQFPDKEHEWNPGIKPISRAPMWAIADEVKKTGGDLESALAATKSKFQEQVDRIYRPALRERVESVASATDLKLKDGLVEKDRSGSPDPKTFKIAEDAFGILRRNPELKYLSEQEKAAVQKLAQVYEKTVDSFYTGANAKLRTLNFSENPKFNSMSGSIDAFVKQERYRNIGAPWWTHSQDEGMTEITDKTSKALPHELYPGQQFLRKIFWLTRKGSEKEPDLDTIRLARTTLADGREGVEVLFHDPASGNWLPFFYEKMGGTWVPQQAVPKFGEPNTYVSVQERCMDCHNRGGKLSPRPLQLSKSEDFHAVGYKDESLISKLLSFH